MARDIFHNLVKEALQKEGWVITHDPFLLHNRKEGGLQTDLGAEKIIAAEKANTRIAVEVKSFVHISILHDFYWQWGSISCMGKSCEKPNQNANCL